jgi:hypothetical protein
MKRYGYRNARPTVRTIVAKYASSCVCCGAAIKAGDIVDYYPIGTIASRNTAAVAHVGGLDGNSARCSAELRKTFEERAVDDYAGRGLDERYEDAGRDICEGGGR